MKKSAYAVAGVVIVVLFLVCLTGLTNKSIEHAKEATIEKARISIDNAIKATTPAEVETGKWKAAVRARFNKGLE